MKVLLFICIFIFSCQIAYSINNGLARTPQMGWNSWNHFGCGINETIVRQTADRIVSSGLAAAGYVYVNVDDCWASWRDANGFVHADNKTFPNGMKALADYVHSKGLKFGLYSDSGTHTCGGRPGSLGFEKEDAESYAKWGVDYLKYDNCYAPENLTPQERYPVMRDALNATGRPILYSLCEWGVNAPWNWAGAVANSWRSDVDIGDNWDNMIRVIDNQIGISAYAHPGAWNDPDMLEVGNGGMDFQAYRSHFALWCLYKSPLLIGCDLTKMSNETRFILMSPELIAVSQDPLGKQGDLISQVGPIQVWAGPLADGSTAFVLFNRHDNSIQWNSTITINFADVGYPNGTVATIRDLYAREDVGNFTNSFTAQVLPHDCFAGRIIPVHSKFSNAGWTPRRSAISKEEL